MRRHSNGTRYREIKLRYAGACTSCGGTIPRGSLAIWDSVTRTVGHDSESIACAAGMRRKLLDEAEGERRQHRVDELDTFDMRVEDDMAEACGRGPFDRPD